jgi:preprotein translocase subunit YajC
MKTLRVNLEDIQKEGFKLENIGKSGADLKTQTTETTSQAPAADAQKAPAQGQGQGNPMYQIALFGVMFLAFYLLIIRPGQKKQKELRDQIAKIKKDDKVLTSGGIIAVVDKVDDNEVILRIDDKTKITVSKAYIVQTMPNVTTPVK